MTTRTPSQPRFRRLTLPFALVLGVQAIWIVLPETIRPGPIRLSFDKQAAASAKLERSKAAWAASLGFMRGDLWADTALTYADLIWIGNSDEKEASNKLAQEGRTSVERALTFSPHRSDVWLLLAALAYSLNWNESRVVAALKLSYYTGSSETSLVPLRLFISVGSQALDDSELQEMVRRDIRMIITRKPDLRPTLVTAYKNALPANKKFIENAITEVDLNFLASVRNQIR